MPERPYTQTNAYKERSYPMLNLMKELHAQGKLTPVQALFMAPRKPDEDRTRNFTILRTIHTR